MSCAVVWGVLGGGRVFWGVFTAAHIFTFLLLSLHIYYFGQFRLGTSHDPHFYWLLVPISPALSLYLPTCIAAHKRKEPAKL